RGLIPEGLHALRDAQQRWLGIDRRLQMGSKVGQGRIHGRLLLAEHMRQSRQRVIVIIRRHGHPAGWLVLWSWSFGGFCSWAWVIFCARIARRAGGWVKARPVSPGRLQKLG